MSEGPFQQPGRSAHASVVDAVIRFCLDNRVVVMLLVLFVASWGVLIAPFDWRLGGLPRDPVPVDAIPDIGENQQIVFTEWKGRSPQDVEDQVTYPLTSALLGMPGVETVRSFSMFGFSTVYVIFLEDVDFYWARSRVLEKLNSLPAGVLPEGVRPALGPDATALGQVFWYTLEGRDPDGTPAGGWDLDELRTVQDWQVRYALMAADGISEVASVGGFVREYQVDVDPDAMRAYGVTLEEIFNAVRASNVDVGARTIELNRAEYVVRGLGFVENLRDIELTVIKARDNVPVRIGDVAHVGLGPALRRGALDKDGAETVGGVVVVRYGRNPLAAIENVKAKIAEIAPGLPAKAVVDWERTRPSAVRTFAREQGLPPYDGALGQHEDWLRWLRTRPRRSWPAWLNLSRATIVPFYDRTGLIHETLGTLNDALTAEIMVTVIVVIVSVMHLRGSLLIGAALPMAVLMVFIAMRLFGVDANIVSLSGIAIAIGTIVDMSIIVCENTLRHLEGAGPEEDRLVLVYRATRQVGGAVVTAVATTVVGFLPVFAMSGAEGKLFKPLAFTKTFALVASVVVALTVVPAGAYFLFARKARSARLRRLLLGGLILAGPALGIWQGWWLSGGALAAVGAWHLWGSGLPPPLRRGGLRVAGLAALAVAVVVLSRYWEPLGPERGFLRNLAFVAGLIAGLLGLFGLIRLIYEPSLRWFLRHKVLAMVAPAVVVLLGATVWLGAHRVFGFLPERLKQTGLWASASRAFPGLGKEFMPPLDEGSFLYMPTTMPHASIGEAMDVLQKQDMAFRAIPEIRQVVGKIGRVDSALDPAPVSMIETLITYKPEYRTDEDGRRLTFRYDRARDEFVRDAAGELVPDRDGRPYRQWRDHIRSPDDIWEEIVRAGSIPGTTSAPRLQPIAARLVMLQSGMRAPMGVKVRGPDLESIERAGLDIERLLKEVPGVEPSAVIADRIVGKPYLEIDIDREAASRYGVSIRKVQDAIEVAIGGRHVTTTVEGRERYPVRVRYLRELRDRIESLGRILVAAPGGAQIPLEQLAEIRYVRGPQAIKSEDTFLVGYVVFDRRPGYAEVDVVEACRRYLARKVESGELVLPAGVSYSFAGTYQNQVRARRTMSVVLPAALLVIFMILYLEFRSVSTTLVVFSGILIAWGGGFILIWLYGQPWFLDAGVFGVNLRDLFQVHPVNLSVAVWVGFLALFGIASDNGVVIASYLDRSFAEHGPRSVAEAREATVRGATTRLRPCLMTSATTILALIPVLTSTGRGSDVMVPMAIPSFGGMLVVLISVFTVPVLYCAVQELRLRASDSGVHPPDRQVEGGRQGEPELIGQEQRAGDGRHAPERDHRGEDGTPEDDDEREPPADGVQPEEDR
ncbi:MAG: efflux RND transporter permease subunit [Candidatus Brocadiaceae bacterium]|jgi:Cu(I)/Ag(I) efflux system membrane protein CusA/SilA